MNATEGRSAMPGSKTSIIIAVTALAVAVLAATPLGQAAGSLVLAKNSVGTAQLKKDAVTGPKVKNGSLLAADFKAGQLPGGPQGPKGDPGPQGLKGETGSPGLSELQLVDGTQTQVVAGAFVVATAACPGGKKAIGGGFAHTGDLEIQGQGPSASLDAWLVGAKNTSGHGGLLAARAVCAKVAS
jgi:hypothetical protein